MRQSAHYFAIHAGLALDRAIIVDSLERGIQAYWRPVETYHIGTDSAFQALRQASQAANIKVIELAADILRTRQVPKAVARTARALQSVGRPEDES